MTIDTTKVWGGRFESGTNSTMELFSRSIETDLNMWPEDILVNRAWAKALTEIGIYSDDELQQVLQGLNTIEAELAAEKFQFQQSDEDIHVAIERRLTELTGESGARIHTGRSRNDQVATDCRLYLKRKIKEWCTELIALQTCLLKCAETHEETILPGYTHLQQAQPIRLSHYFLAIFWSVDQALSRLADYYKRLDVMPLGAGALAGSAFNVDRQALARELHFGAISHNSIHVTGDRDFCAELLFVIGGFFTTLSRVCAEMQIWNAVEFGFVTFSDGFATGSSMMPQKKNPDAMELIRGKAAAAISAANQLLILQKGLPLTYNRDLQEDKATAFYQLDQVIISTAVFTGAFSQATFNGTRMEAGIDDLTLATDIADYLVKKGVPFRKAHGIVGEVVRAAINSKCALGELPLEKYKESAPEFEHDVFDLFSAEASLEARNIDGGTGKHAVAKQMKQAQTCLKAYNDNPFLDSPASPA